MHRNLRRKFTFESLWCDIIRTQHDDGGFSWRRSTHRDTPRHSDTKACKGTVLRLIYMAIALVLVAALAGYLGWRLYATAMALKRMTLSCRGMEQDRAIRQNLQQVLDGRIAENRKLKARLRKTEEALHEAQQQVHDLNLNLFHESGLRILKEKEEGARRMKLDLMERQLDEADLRLKRQAEEQRASEEMLQQIIAEKQAEIDRLNAAMLKRATRRRTDSLPNQVTLNDLIGEGKHII